MDAKVIAFLENHKKELGDDNWNVLIADAVKEDLLDEILDFMAGSKIPVPIEIVEKQLKLYYCDNKSDGEQIAQKINLITNKQLFALYKTFAK